MRSQTLSQQLAPYPALAVVLGADWIAEQEATDPGMSKFRLARWLRSGSAADLIQGIDQVLGDIQRANIPNIDHHLVPLRTSSIQFMETMTEIYLLKWLIDRPQFSFVLPPSGADFHIDLGGIQPFALEVITPRKTLWLDELYDRMLTLSRMRRYSGDLTYSVDINPSVDASVLDEIMQNTIASFNRADSRPPNRKAFTQNYRKYGFRVSWTPDGNPHFSANSGTRLPDPLQAFRLIAKAARSKARQLPNGSAGAVMVGIGQHVLDVYSLIDILRHQREHGLSDFEGQIRGQWRNIPPKVKHLCLYELSLDSTTPFRTTWLKNPFSNLPDPPNFTNFQQLLTY